MDLRKIFSEYFNLSTNSVNDFELIYGYGNGKQALLYSLLFLPELEELQGSIFLAWAISDRKMRERFLDLKMEGKKPLSEIESSFNFVEIGYLFGPTGRNTTDSEDDVLAKKLAQAWKGWLYLKFPKREFKVKILSHEETGSTVGVSFNEMR